MRPHHAYPTRLTRDVVVITRKLETGEFQLAGSSWLLQARGLGSVRTGNDRSQSVVFYRAASRPSRFLTLVGVTHQPPWRAYDTQTPPDLPTLQDPRSVPAVSHRPKDWSEALGPYVRVPGLANLRVQVPGPVAT